MRNIISDQPSGSNGAIAENKDLTGHKLLGLVPWKTPEGYAERLKEKYPGMKVFILTWDPWSKPELPPNVTDKDWTTVTVLLTGPLFPAKEMVPKLQLVQLQSAGANYVLDKPLFKDTDVAFCTANGVHGPQIAEWVITTFLAFQHNIPRFLDNMRDGKWERSHDLDTQDAVGQRVGILGYGAIGRQVARVATAMGMEAYAYTNRPRPDPESRRDKSYHPPGLGDPDGKLPSKWFSGTESKQIDEFLSSGLDLLVVAVPLTPQTRGMLAAPQFKLLAEKKTYVSNIGRGPVINTDDLITALDEGWIRGAALDVTDPEPLPEDHPLWHKKNVIVTPHVSGNSHSYVTRLLDILEINLERLSKGEEFLNHVTSFAALIRGKTLGNLDEIFGLLTVERLLSQMIKISVRDVDTAGDALAELPSYGEARRL